MDKRYPITLDGREIGYMEIGRAPNCHPECDYNILNIFIEEGERGKGIGRKFVTDFITNHPGIYCLDVPDKNRVIVFWRKTFNGANYKEIRLRDVPHGSAPTYYFKVRR